MENKKEKVVCFAGHRFDWQNIGIEDKLENIVEYLINSGYTTFFDGNKGYFDELALRVVLTLKKRFPSVKIVKVLSNLNNKNLDNFKLDYSNSIFPNIENCFPKQKIVKRNQWMIDNCDILVCHIKETHKSGAYLMVKYARKINKPIIYI